MLEFNPFDTHERKQTKLWGKWGKMKKLYKLDWRKLDGNYR